MSHEAMSHTAFDAVGFSHSPKGGRTRRRAVAQFITTVSLALSLVVAVSVVTIGFARAAALL
jgi:hypothetical protein